MSVTEGAGVVMAWPALCARAAGDYEREGLRVELVVLSESDATAGLRSGAVPVARRGADPHFEVLDAEPAVRIIAGLCAKPPLHLYAQREVATIAELRGRTVAGVAGRSASALYLRMALADGGLAEGDVNYRDVGRAGNRIVALRAGDVDAGLLSPPASAAAADEGFSLLCRLPAAYPNVPYAVLEANRAHVEPATLVALLRAEVRSLRRLRDPDYAGTAAAVLAGELGIPLDAARATYGEMLVRDDVFSVDGAIGPGDVARILDAFATYARTRFAHQPEEYLDRAFLAAACSEVGP